MADPKTIVIREPKPKKPARRRGRGKSATSNSKLAIGLLGGNAAAFVQGQVHRRLAPTHRQAPRVVAIVTGLASIAATMMDSPAIGAVLAGPTNAQIGIESSLVDVMGAPNTGK